jgi:hypothetical protein
MKTISSSSEAIFPIVVASRVSRIMDDVELEDVELDFVDSEDVECKGLG